MERPAQGEARRDHSEFDSSLADSRIVPCGIFSAPQISKGKGLVHATPRRLRDKGLKPVEERRHVFRIKRGNVATGRYLSIPLAAIPVAPTKVIAIEDRK